MQSVTFKTTHGELKASNDINTERHAAELTICITLTDAQIEIFCEAVPKTAEVSILECDSQKS